MLPLRLTFTPLLLTCTFPYSHSQALSPTLMFTHSHTHDLPRILIGSHSLSLIVTYFHSYSQTHIHSPHAHILAFTHMSSLKHSHSQSHVHSFTLSHRLMFSLMPTHTLALRLSLTGSSSLTDGHTLDSYASPPFPLPLLGSCSLTLTDSCFFIHAHTLSHTHPVCRHIRGSCAEVYQTW